VIRGQGEVNTNQIQSAWRTPTENYMSEGVAMTAVRWRERGSRGGWKG